MIKINLKPFTQYFCDMLSAQEEGLAIFEVILFILLSQDDWLAIVSGLHRILIIWNIPLFISQRSSNMPTSFILISDYCYCVCMCGGMNTMAQRRSSELFVESVLSSPLCQYDGSNLGGQACDMCLCLLSCFTWPLLPFTSLLFLLCLFAPASHSLLIVSFR